MEHRVIAGQELSLGASRGEREILLLQQPRRGQAEGKLHLGCQGCWRCPSGGLVRVPGRLRPVLCVGRCVRDLVTSSACFTTLSRLVEKLLVPAAIGQLLQDDGY